MRPTALLLLLVGCGAATPAEINRKGEDYFLEWQRTEDHAAYRKAIRHFVDACGMEPENPQYHYNLGTALAAAGFFKQAVPELETALRLNPNFPAAQDALQLVKDEWAADLAKAKGGS
jgi:tetratricopeptide (TPR) repeat protein